MLYNLYLQDWIDLLLFISHIQIIEKFYKAILLNVQL